MSSPSSHLASSSGAFVLGGGLSIRFGCRVRVAMHEDDLKTHSCDVTLFRQRMTWPLSSGVLVLGGYTLRFLGGCLF